MLIYIYIYIYICIHKLVNYGIRIWNHTDTDTVKLKKYDTRHDMYIHVKFETVN